MAARQLVSLQLLGLQLGEEGQREAELIGREAHHPTQSPLQRAQMSQRRRLDEREEVSGGNSAVMGVGQAEAGEEGEA